MKNSHLLTLVLMVALLTAGCTSQKRLLYFSDVDKESASVFNSMVDFRHESKIVAGDELAISVSALDPKTVASFNLPFVAYSAPYSEELYAAPSMPLYTVALDGSISFPVLGKVAVADLTRKELIELLEERIAQFVQDPIVNVRFMNYSVTVLGEVERPGAYQLTHDRTTILDVLGIAGDLTPYGKRETILIAREINGAIEFGRLSLNDGSIFTSPYYYVQQNDVIYVEPNKVKSITSQNLPLFLSMITSTASVAAIIFSVTQKGN